MTFTLFYNSHHIMAENCIATWDARLMRENHSALGQDGKPFTAWKDGSGRPRHYTNFDAGQPDHAQDPRGDWRRPRFYTELRIADSLAMRSPT